MGGMVLGYRQEKARLSGHILVTRSTIYYKRRGKVDAANMLEATVS